MNVTMRAIAMMVVIASVVEQGAAAEGAKLRRILTSLGEERRALKRMADVPPSSSTHYVTGRRFVRDDFHLAHGGPMTETVLRAVSREELIAIRRGNALMAKRLPRRYLYVTSFVPSSAKEARRVLALPRMPEFVVRLQVPARVFSPATTVPPFHRLFRRTLPGGGLERTAQGTRVIPVRVLSYQPLQK